MELKNSIRYIFTFGYNFLVNLLLKLPGFDTETGCKIFRMSTVKPILKYTKNDKWFWDTEIIYFSYINHLKISELQIALNKNYEINSSVSFFSDIIEYSKNLYNLWKQQKK